MQYAAPYAESTGEAPVDFTMKTTTAFIRSSEEPTKAAFTPITAGKGAPAQADLHHKR